MTDPIATAGAVPDPTYGSATRPPVDVAPAPSPVAAAPAPETNDLRLVIEDDQAAGCFVYKTVDWRTGKVVQQLPREAIIKMREADGYSAGAVIKASV
jgi:hypothetical protein